MKSIKFAVAGALLAVSGVSMADPITVDGGWYGFCFSDGIGNPATNGCKNKAVGTAGNTFTFTLSGDGVLKVTDAFILGDRFDVWVDNLFAFTTSVAGTGVVETDPDAAYNSGYYSTGSFLLAAGSHQVDIFTNVTPGGTGGAYIEVESRGGKVPEPDALALTGLALAALAWSRRSKKA